MSTRRALTLACCLAAGCAAGPAAAGESATIFACEHGRIFAVERLDGAVRVTTGAGSFALGARPSSIGLKFASGAATLILDEDRAALNGLPGGPFRRCREAAAAGREPGRIGPEALTPVAPAAPARAQQAAEPRR